jgi:transcriptional regulator with XRE-family HTH domain
MFHLNRQRGLHLALFMFYLNTTDSMGDIIGKYERNEVKPSIEVAAKIANALEVSLDYLVGKTPLKWIIKLLNVCRIFKNLMSRINQLSLRWWMPFFVIENLKSIMLSKQQKPRMGLLLLFISED